MTQSTAMNNARRAGVFAAALAVLAAALLILTATPARAQDETLEAEIRRLIEQLGHDEYEMRLKAQDRLLEIGPPAEESVRKALAHPDPEIRARAEAILKELRWYLPVEQRDMLGADLAAKVREWETLQIESRLPLFIKCIWILGDGADALCLKALRHDSSPEIRARAARWFLEEGRREHLPELLQIAREQGGGDVWTAAVGLALRCNEPDIALNELKKDKYLPVETGLLVAKLYERKGEYKKAADMYKQIAYLEPQNISFPLQQAEMLTRAGEKENALAALRGAARSHADSAEAQMAVLRALAEYGFDDEAAKIAEEAAEKFDDYRFPYVLAQSAEKAGNGNTAIAHYFDALKMASRDFEIFLVSESLADVLVAEHGVEKALADLRERADKADRTGDFTAATRLNLLLAQTASAAGRADETREACRTVRERYERAVGLSFADLPGALGQMLERVEAWQDAADTYRAGMEAGSKSEGRIAALGRCLYRESERLAAEKGARAALQKKAEALQAWRMLVEKERKQNPSNYALLIDTLLAHNMPDEAAKASEAALRKYPTLLSILSRRLRILLNAGDTAGAASMMTEAILRFEPRDRSAAAKMLVSALPKTADVPAIIKELEKLVGGA